MASKDLITIRELLRAANKVKGYTASSIAKKELGAVYSFNKVLKVNPKNSIIEVSMLIKGVTDMVKSGDSKRPVAAHRVRIRIKGASNEEVTAEELVRRIRSENPTLANPNEYTTRDILNMAREGKELLKDKAIMEVNRVILELTPPKHLVEHKDGTASYEPLPDKWTFAIIDKRISADSKVQVKCSCSSYFWTFQYENALANIDIAGKRAAKSYENFQDSKVKRNPESSIGLCKHLMLMFGMLMHDKVIKEVQKGRNNPAAVYELNLEKFRTMGRMSKKGFEDLVKEYKSDLRRKTSARNDMWFVPKKRGKYAPKKPKPPKGTRANITNPAKSFKGVKNARKRGKK